MIYQVSKDSIKDLFGFWRVSGQPKKDYIKYNIIITMR